MKKTRVLVAIILVVCVFGALFSGCGRSDGTTDGQNATQKPPTDVDESSISGTLNVALAADMAPDSVTEWTKMFKEDYPDVTLNVTLIDASNYQLTIDPLVAADNMPDVTGVAAADYFYNLADKGYLKDVTASKGWDKQVDFLKEKYTSPSGVKFAVANGLSTMILYYNEDHFADAGISAPPENWEEFVEVCEKLKAAGHVPYAVAGGGPNNLGHSFVGFGVAYEIFASGYDPDWAKKAKEGPYDFGTAEWQKVLEKVAYMRENGYFQSGYESADLYEVLRMLAAGEASMSIQQSAQASNIFIDENVNLNCTLVPWNEKGQSQVGISTASDGYALGRNDNDVDELAMIFFDYVSYDNAYIYQNLTGGVSPFKSKDDMPKAIVDPRVQAAWDKNSILPQTGLPVQSFTDPLYAQVKVFVQEVTHGLAEPDMIGEYLNPAQEEYVAGIGQ